jgi:hypothetical protein
MNENSERIYIPDLDNCPTQKNLPSFDNLINFYNKLILILNLLYIILKCLNFKPTLKVSTSQRGRAQKIAKRRKVHFVRSEIYRNFAYSH